MKEEWTIFFEMKGLGDVTSLHPLKDKRFPTEEIAKDTLKYLMSVPSSPDIKYCILKSYSKE